jgi:hypothetical protein
MVPSALITRLGLCRDYELEKPALVRYYVCFFILGNKSTPRRKLQIERKNKDE